MEPHPLFRGQLSKRDGNSHPNSPGPLACRTRISLIWNSFPKAHGLEKAKHRPHPRRAGKRTGDRIENNRRVTALSARADASVPGNEADPARLWRRGSRPVRRLSLR